MCPCGAVEPLPPILKLIYYCGRSVKDHFVQYLKGYAYSAGGRFPWSTSVCRDRTTSRPADLEWWEPASSIEQSMLLEYEAGLAAQAAAEAADEAEDAELEATDDEEE